jgi:hypothetical protein
MMPRLIVWLAAVPALLVPARAMTADPALGARR